MKKPHPWAAPVRLTVVPPNAQRRRAANPANAAGNIGRADSAPGHPMSGVGRAADIIPPSLPPVPTVASRTTNASRALLELLGHSASCAQLTRAGLIGSCDCTVQPMEDPAVAVGLVVHYARISLARRIPIPAVIIELLARRVEEGDPACVMVAEWLDSSGLLELKPSSRKRSR